jgi:hypothetical protein
VEIVVPVLPLACSRSSPVILPQEDQRLFVRRLVHPARSDRRLDFTRNQRAP